MGRPRKEEASNIPDVQEKKKLKKEKFYAYYSIFHFVYPVVDENGAIVYKTNPNNGNFVHDVDGKKIPVTRMERFDTLEFRMSKGFLSVKELDPNDEDPQNQAKLKALRDLAASDNDVYTEDEHEKRANFAAWTEKQKREALEEKIGELTTKAARADELEEKIAKMEAEIKAKG